MSGDKLVDGVTYGTGWKGDLTYYFSTSADQYSYTGEAQRDFAPATKHQAESALFALERSFGTAANDGFSVEGFTKASISAGSATSSTLRFAQSDAPATAYAYVPGEYKQAGDMWFGRNYDYTNAQAGNYAWHTILHEIGHALGLKHGHESQNGFAALPAEYDSLEYSVMTYRSYQGSDIARYSYSEWSAPQSYMIADIAALQRMYGADYTTNRGDTVYSWDQDSGDTRVNGKIGIDAGGTVIFATIWDGGGNDTYNLSSYQTDLQIDLRAGKHSQFDEAQLAYLGGDTYASGSIYNALRYDGDVRSLIENAVGGIGADTLTGNLANNKLYAGAGADRLFGGWGNDRLLGQAGDDLLKGGPGRDYLRGGEGNDVLTGGSDGDVFHFTGLMGSDVITDFADGIDKLYFDLSVQQVLTSAEQVGDDVVLDFGDAGSLTLMNFDRHDLSMRDFIL